MLLDMAATTLRARGFRIAGAVQHSRPVQTENCSEFCLEDLSTGTLHQISQALAAMPGDAVSTKGASPKHMRGSRRACDQAPTR